MLRDLQPTSDRISLDEGRSGFDAVRGVVTEMGRILASAQLRSGGRDGSAIADELIALARARGARPCSPWPATARCRCRRTGKSIRKPRTTALLRRRDLVS